MASVAAIILTHNEEKNIGRCLDSLSGFADEIIVLDSQSTDSTSVICKNKGISFFDVEWKGYAATRNDGIKHAKSDYILFIDADEALSEELKTNLIREKTSLSGAYIMNRLNYFYGKPIRHGGWYPDLKLRLVPRGKAAWKEREVHETLEVEKGIKTSHITGSLLHFSYDTKGELHERAEKYAQLAAKEIAASGKRLLFFKMYFSPLFKFIKDYIFRAGFLDGNSGWFIARESMRETYLKYKLAGNSRRTQKKKKS